MSKRGGLGRGLSALIPGAPEAGEGGGPLEVPVNAVSPNPKQPRTHWDEGEIAALCGSDLVVGVGPVPTGLHAYKLVAGLAGSGAMTWSLDPTNRFIPIPPCEKDVE